MTKVVTVIARFNELKIKYAEQQGRGRGSTLQAAMGAAMRDLLKQPGLKAKRFTTFTATVLIGTEQEEETNDQAGTTE
jgi:hypothetical protein